MIKNIWINIVENEWHFLITTSIDDWIYAEWKTLEDALINFLDVFKIVKELKQNIIFKEENNFIPNINKNLFSLPISI